MSLTDRQTCVWQLLIRPQWYSKLCEEMHTECKRDFHRKNDLQQNPAARQPDVPLPDTKTKKLLPDTKVLMTKNGSSIFVFVALAHFNVQTIFRVRKPDSLCT